MAGVQKEDTKYTHRHDAFKDGVVRNTPQDGTHTLQGEEQQGTGHQEAEQDLVSASSLGSHAEKGSNPGVESIRVEVVQDTAHSDPFGTKFSDLYQQQSGRHYDLHSSIVQPVEGDQNRGSPILRTIKYPSNRERRLPHHLIRRKYGMFHLRWWLCIPQKGKCAERSDTNLFRRTGRQSKLRKRIGSLILM